MIEINGKTYRNLEEQVLKNKEDIDAINEGAIALADFGLKVVGNVPTAADLPSTYAGDYGDCYIVGQTARPPYTMYVWTRPIGTHLDNFWLNLGLFPRPGAQGVPGESIPGPKGDTVVWFTGYDPATADGVHQGDMYLVTQASGAGYEVGDVFMFGTGQSFTYKGNIRGPQGPQGTVQVLNTTGYNSS